VTPAVRLALRLAGAIVGGYVLSAQLASLGGALLAAAGMQRGEATMLALLSAYLLYAGVLLWALWEPHLGRLWSVVAGGSAAAFLALQALR
jgi:hypothetical protein